MTTWNRVLYVASTREKLSLAELVVQTTFTASATNFYTFQLWVTKPGQTFGVTLGSTYTLANRTLTASEPVTLYREDNGYGLDAGDVVRMVVTSTGTPVALSDPCVRLTTQAITR